ncbi:hypothetical protein [Peribacillus butanolivorans]|uniref:hypothetical protein n=1 Tax=Peribacillus butanolivorans TaxID=421767 RepID=UPI0030EB2BB4
MTGSKPHGQERSTPATVIIYRYKNCSTRNNWLTFIIRRGRIVEEAFGKDTYKIKRPITGIAIMISPTPSGPITFAKTIPLANTNIFVINAAIVKIKVLNQGVTLTDNLRWF